jgi:CDP-6-deoxy-D-xylo-4-hexulose-3-dehydrase
MKSKKEIEQEINELVREFYKVKDYQFVPGETKIPLQYPPYGAEEVIETLESLLSTWVTMGKKVKLFEEMFSQYIGTKFGAMVHSGSSANLLALSVLSSSLLQNRINPGDEIITPSTTWITTVYPIVNINAIPVIVDVDHDTFNIDIEQIEKAITDKTKAIMPVHLLGNPCEIKQIMEIAKKYNLFVIEDTCEAHGATIDGKKVGSFGDINTFSFFFSHHITTIEGGIVLTDNEEYYEMGKSMRVFGWIRDLKNKNEITSKYKHVDPRFLFTTLGYNLRPTEIQGAFGIHQIKKLEDYINQRRENSDYWIKRFDEYSDYITTQKERSGTRHVWFGFPLTVNEDAPFNRDELVKYLEEKKIETRPIQVPNILDQPSVDLFKYRTVGDLKNSKFISSNSFWFGNNQAIGKEEREFVADTICNFIESKVKR